MNFVIIPSLQMKVLRILFAFSQAYFQFVEHKADHFLPKYEQPRYLIIYVPIFDFLVLLLMFIKLPIKGIILIIKNIENHR